MSEGKEKELLRGTGRRYPTFSGEDDDYKNWRMQVEEEYLKYPGIEIRMCLKGRALYLSESIKRDDLKRGGEREILKVLDKACMKDKTVNRIMNIEKYYKIQRKAGETVKEYVEMYEHVVWKCKEEGGGELPKEMRGWHMVVKQD